MQERTLRIAGDKRKTIRTVAEFRPMVVAEAKRLRSGDHAPFVRNDGRVAEVKINGQPKTWKRSPGVVVPLKYGLYEFAYDDRRDAQGGDPMERLLVQTSEWRDERLIAGEWVAQ